jgi:hypothetical protein
MENYLKGLMHIKDKKNLIGMTHVKAKNLIDMTHGELYNFTY